LINGVKNRPETQHKGPKKAPQKKKKHKKPKKKPQRLLPFAVKKGAIKTSDLTKFAIKKSNSEGLTSLFDLFIFYKPAAWPGPGKS
jgi:hypothetical protein